MHGTYDHPLTKTVVVTLMVKSREGGTRLWI